MRLREPVTQTEYTDASRCSPHVGVGRVRTGERQPHRASASSNSSRRISSTLVALPPLPPRRDPTAPGGRPAPPGGAEGEGDRDVDAAADAAVEQDRGSAVEGPGNLGQCLGGGGARSSWRPPWLETTMPAAPCSTASAASSAVSTPLTRTGRWHAAARASRRARSRRGVDQGEGSRTAAARSPLARRPRSAPRGPAGSMKPVAEVALALAPRGRSTVTTMASNPRASRLLHQCVGDGPVLESRRAGTSRGAAGAAVATSPGGAVASIKRRIGVPAAAAAARPCPPRLRVGQALEGDRGDQRPGSGAACRAARSRCSPPHVDGIRGRNRHPCQANRGSPSASPRRQHLGEIAMGCPAATISFRRGALKVGDVDQLVHSAATLLSINGIGDRATTPSTQQVRGCCGPVPAAQRFQWAVEHLYRVPEAVELEPAPPRRGRLGDLTGGPIVARVRGASPCPPPPRARAIAASPSGCDEALVGDGRDQDRCREPAAEDLGRGLPEFADPGEQHPRAQPPPRSRPRRSPAGSARRPPRRRSSPAAPARGFSAPRARRRRR